ncbi:PspC domain-containing protein [Kosmotoga sp.]|nr:PspC domain-containing protein [Kosmotoga sp.]
MKKLYKSRKNKVIDGVCGGLAEYLEVDATVVRLLWALTAFVWGVGILLYILAMIIVPREPVSDEESEKEEPFEEKSPNTRGKTWNAESGGKLLIAIVVIVIGLFLLLPGTFSVFFWKFMLGLMLIAGGGYIILKSLRKE